MIKKVWLTADDGRFVLSIREEPTHLPLYHGLITLPPTDPVNGKRLNIDEAKAMALEEPHHIIGVLQKEDLFKLRDALDKAIAEHTC